MRNLYLTSILFLLFLIPQINAQSHLQKGWEIISSGGLDFAGMLRINPTIGAGDSQISFGGAFSSTANYNSSKTSWTNSISLNYGVQKTGFTNLSNPNVKVPFQKSIDQLRINSKFGYRSSILYPGARFLYTVDFSFLSQLTKTYEGNFAKKPDLALGAGNSVISKFLSPATTHISAGIDYRPIDQLSIYYSPAALKFVIVLDDNIADSIIIDDAGNPASLHGNPILRDENGVINGFKNVDSQLGSLLRISYNDFFAEKRFILNSSISLYSNYLNRPEKIDVDWTNEIGIKIIEGLQISLWSNLFYDFDIPVQKTENLRIIEGSFTRGISFSQQLLIKYSKTF